MKIVNNLLLFILVFGQLSPGFSAYAQTRGTPVKNKNINRDKYLFDNNCRDFAVKQDYVRGNKSIINNSDARTERYFIWEHINKDYEKLVTDGSIEKAAKERYDNYNPYFPPQSLVLCKDNEYRIDGNCLAYKAYCTEEIAMKGMEEELEEWRVRVANCTNQKYLDRHPTHCQRNFSKSLAYLETQSKKLAKTFDQREGNKYVSAYFNEAAGAFSKYKHDLSALEEANKQAQEIEKKQIEQKENEAIVMKHLDHCKQLVANEGNDIHGRNLEDNLINGYAACGAPTDSLTTLSESEISKLADQMDNISLFSNADDILDKVTKESIKKSAKAIFTGFDLFMNKGNAKDIGGKDKEWALNNLMCNPQSSDFKFSMYKKSLCSKELKPVIEEALSEYQDQKNMVPVKYMEDDDIQSELDYHINPGIEGIDATCAKAKKVYNQVDAMYDCTHNALAIDLPPIEFKDEKTGKLIKLDPKKDSKPEKEPLYYNKDKEGNTIPYAEDGGPAMAWIENKDLPAGGYEIFNTKPLQLALESSDSFNTYGTHGSMSVSIPTEIQSLPKGIQPNAESCEVIEYEEYQKFKQVQSLAYAEANGQMNKMKSSKLGGLLITDKLKKEMNYFNDDWVYKRCFKGSGDALKKVSLDDMNASKKEMMNLAYGELGEVLGDRHSSDKTERVQQYLKTHPLTVAQLLKTNPDPDYADRLCHFMRDIYDTDVYERNRDMALAGVMVVGAILLAIPSGGTSLALIGGGSVIAATGAEIYYQDEHAQDARYQQSRYQGSGATSQIPLDDALDGIAKEKRKEEDALFARNLSIVFASVDLVTFGGGRLMKTFMSSSKIAGTMRALKVTEKGVATEKAFQQSVKRGLKHMNDLGKGHGLNPAVINALPEEDLAYLAVLLDKMDDAQRLKFVAEIDKIKNSKHLEKFLDLMNSNPKIFTEAGELDFKLISKNMTKAQELDLPFGMKLNDYFSKSEKMIVDNSLDAISVSKLNDFKTIKSADITLQNNGGKVLTEGSGIIVDGERLEIQKMLGKGGNSEVFELSNNTVVKISKSDGAIDDATKKFVDGQEFLKQNGVGVIDIHKQGKVVLENGDSADLLFVEKLDFSHGNKLDDYFSGFQARSNANNDFVVLFPEAKFGDDFNYSDLMKLDEKSLAGLNQSQRSFYDDILRRKNAFDEFTKESASFSKIGDFAPHHVVWDDATGKWKIYDMTDSYQMIRYDEKAGWIESIYKNGVLTEKKLPNYKIDEPKTIWSRFYSTKNPAGNIIPDDFIEGINKTVANSRDKIKTVDIVSDADYLNPVFTSDLRSWYKLKGTSSVDDAKMYDDIATHLDDSKIKYTQNESSASEFILTGDDQTKLGQYVASLNKQGITVKYDPALLKNKNIGGMFEESKATLYLDHKSILKGVPSSNALHEATHWKRAQNYASGLDDQYNMVIKSTREKIFKPSDAFIKKYGIDMDSNPYSTYFSLDEVQTYSKGMRQALNNGKVDTKSLLNNAKYSMYSNEAAIFRANSLIDDVNMLEKTPALFRNESLYFEKQLVNGKEMFVAKFRSFGKSGEGSRGSSEYIYEMILSTPEQIAMAKSFQKGSKLSGIDLLKEMRTKMSIVKKNAQDASKNIDEIIAIAKNVEKQGLATEEQYKLLVKYTSSASSSTKPVKLGGAKSSTDEIIEGVSSTPSPEKFSVSEISSTPKLISRRVEPQVIDDFKTYFKDRYPDSGEVKLLSDPKTLEGAHIITPEGKVIRPEQIVELDTVEDARKFAYQNPLFEKYGFGYQGADELGGWSRFESNFKNSPFNGMVTGWTKKLDNGNWARVRLDWDPVKGAHYNTELKVFDDTGKFKTIKFASEFKCSGLPCTEKQAMKLVQALQAP